MKIKVNHAAGIVVSILGGMVSFYSSTLRFGNLQNMGAGFFPTITGLILLLLGIGIFFSRSQELLQVNITKQELKAITLILLSICFFALLIEHAGIILSCFIMTILSRRAIKYQNTKSNILLATVLSVAGVLLFWYLLDLNLKLFLSFV